MLLLNFMLIYKRKYNIFKVILIGLIGIFLANIFDIFRTSGTLSFDVLKEVINRGLFVNTISYSFYAGTQIINYVQTIVNTKVHLIDYIIAIFLGKSSNLDLASLALNAGFVNKGGGMTHAYLYFWNGYIGTLIFSFIIGKIITKIFNSDKNYAIILRVTITIFSIRWIVYFPIALFRTAIFVPLLCFTITEYFNDILNKRQNKYLKVSERSDNNE